MRSLIFIFLLALSLSASALDFVPAVTEYETNIGKSGFTISDKTRIEVVDESLVEMAREFAFSVKQSVGIDMLKKVRPKQYISLYIDEDLRYSDAYFIRVLKNRVEVFGGSESGVYYGLQTLKQIFPAAIESDEIVANVDWRLPMVAVTDVPNKERRGVLVDVSKDNLDIAKLQHLCNNMGTLKLNVLYLSLSDSQIAYLNTTDTLANAVSQSLYFKKAQQELRAFASKRFIQVVFINEKQKEELNVLGEEIPAEFIFKNTTENAILEVKGSDIRTDEYFERIMSYSEMMWVSTDYRNYEDFERRILLFQDRIDNWKKN